MQTKIYRSSHRVSDAPPGPRPSRRCFSCLRCHMDHDPSGSERQSSKVGTSRDGDRNGTANYLNISCEARKLTSPAVAPSSATRPHPTQAIRWRPLAGPPPGSRDEMRLPLCVKCGRFRPKTMILCVGRRAGREFSRAPTLYGRQGL